MSLALFTTRIVAGVISSSFVSMRENLGAAGAWLVFAPVAAVAFVFVFSAIPETKGHSLEEIADVFRRKQRRPANGGGGSRPQTSSAAAAAAQAAAAQRAGAAREARRPEGIAARTAPSAATAPPSASPAAEPATAAGAGATPSSAAAAAAPGTGGGEGAAPGADDGPHTSLLPAGSCEDSASAT